MNAYTERPREIPVNPENSDFVNRLVIKKNLENGYVANPDDLLKYKFTVDEIKNLIVI